MICLQIRFWVSGYGLTFKLGTIVIGKLGSPHSPSIIIYNIEPESNSNDRLYTMLDLINNDEANFSDIPTWWIDGDI